MDQIMLAFGDRPTITAHDSTGLALLLAAIAAPAGLTLAEKLKREASADDDARAEVELGEAERAALLASLDELRSELLPDRLLTLRTELAAELGFGGSTHRPHA